MEIDLCGARYDGFLLAGEGIACHLAPHGDDVEHQFDGIQGGQHTVATWSERDGEVRVSRYVSEPLS